MSVRSRRALEKKRQSKKELEFEKRRHIARAKASIKAGTKYLASNAPMIAGTVVTVALTGSVVPLVSTAVSTSMNTVGKAAEAAAATDKKIMEDKNKK